MRRWGPDEQGARDAATLLPIAAAILLLPPVVTLFTAPVLVAGIPLIAVYIFAVWALAILGAWFVARNHARASGGTDSGRPEADGAAAGTVEQDRR